jgi:hypothetical protein
MLRTVLRSGFLFAILLAIMMLGSATRSWS